MFQPELRCVSSMHMHAYICMLEKDKFSEIILRSTATVL